MGRNKIKLEGITITICVFWKQVDDYDKNMMCDNKNLSQSLASAFN